MGFVGGYPTRSTAPRLAALPRNAVIPPGSRFHAQRCKFMSAIHSVYRAHLSGDRFHCERMENPERSNDATKAVVTLL